MASAEVKVLYTSAKFQVDVFDESYSVKKIQKLRKAESVDLFLKKIPLSEDDKKLLFEHECIKELHEVSLPRYA